jgi:hypothetical protein
LTPRPPSPAPAAAAAVPSSPPHGSVPAPAAQPASLYYGQEGASQVPPSAPSNDQGIPVAAPAPAPHMQQPLQYQLVYPPVPTLAELEDRIYNRGPTPAVQFQCCKYISDAWVFVKHNCCTMALVCLFWFVVAVGLEILTRLILSPLLSQCDGMHSHTVCRPYAYMILNLLAKFIVSVLVYTPMLSSTFGAVFDAMRTNSYVSFRQFFGSFKKEKYGRLMRLSLLLNVVHFLFSFLIIPGIWFGLVSIFAVPLHLEHNLTATKAVKYSIKVSHRYFCHMILLTIALCLLQVLGFFALIVGLLVTTSIAFVTICYTYHHLVGVNRVPVMVARRAGVEYI